LAEYKDELDEPDDVTWLDDEEMIISVIWTLSIENGGFIGTVCNYDVVRDGCKKYKLDTIDVFRVCKSMANELNKG